MNTYKVEYTVYGQAVSVKVKAANAAGALILSKREIAMSIKINGAPELIEGLEKQVEAPKKKSKKK